MHHINVQHQIQRFIHIGFPKLLNLTDEEYVHPFQLNGYSAFPAYNDRFELPVLVDPRISVTDAMTKAGISNFLKPEELRHVASDATEPYIFFTHDARKYSAHSAATAISEFAEDEEGCTLQELAFFYLHYPSVFEGIAVDAIQTLYLKDYHPCLVKVTANAELGAHWHNDHTKGIHILSKGKHLYTFNAD